MHFAGFQKTDVGEAFLGELEIDLIGGQVDKVPRAIQGNVIGVFVGQYLQCLVAAAQSKRGQARISLPNFKVSTVLARRRQLAHHQAWAACRADALGATGR